MHTHKLLIDGTEAENAVLLEASETPPVVEQHETRTVDFVEQVDILRYGVPFLFINKDSRDALVSANAFLTVFKEHLPDGGQVQKIIDHISDMLYGFDKE